MIKERAYLQLYLTYHYLKPWGGQVCIVWRRGVALGHYRGEQRVWLLGRGYGREVLVGVVNWCKLDY